MAFLSFSGVSDNPSRKSEIDPTPMSMSCQHGCDSQKRREHIIESQLASELEKIHCSPSLIRRKLAKTFISVEMI